MSNSAAYEWSYVDIEAARRRELRAALAQEVNRSHHLRGQAKSLRRAYRTAKVQVQVVSVSGSADSAELAAALQSAERINREAEAELSRLAADVWSLPAEEQPAPARRAARPAPAARAGEDRTGPDRAREDRTAQVKGAALAEAEALLRRDGAACEPEDLPVFARRLDALRQARNAEEARTLFHDLGVLVHRSTQRQRHAARTAALRARLLDRLEDVAPEERERLGSAVTEAPDPAHLEGEVEWTVARADTARHRSTVADTLMRVLRERDYAVGDDFADLLAEDGSAVVPFGRAADAAAADGGAAIPDGYGLRVALAPDRPGLTTVLVRAPKAGEHGESAHAMDAGDDEADRRVQQWFCDAQLPLLEDAVREQGVGLARTSALPPGVRPTAVVPDGSWPDTGRAHDHPADDGTGADTAAATGADDQATDLTAPAAPRRKKKAKSTRSATYGQERQRER